MKSNTFEKAIEYQNSIKNEMHFFVISQSVPKKVNTHSPRTCCHTL